LGQPNAMLNALARLGNMHAEGQQMPKSLQAMGIAGGIGSLFASHPPMEERIAALKAYQG
jgi:heat shock protein HtpX